MVKPPRFGKYIYGVVDLQDDYSGPSSGPEAYLDQIRQDRSLNDLNILGIEGGLISTIKHKRIAAIASDISLDSARRIRSSIANSQKDGLSYIMTHKKVIEAFREAGNSVVPIQFGSILLPDNVHRLLVQGYQYFVQKTQLFSNKDEYGISVFATATTEKLISQAISGDPQIIALSNKATSESELGRHGSLYFTKLRQGDLGKNLRFRFLDRISRQVHESLAPFAFDSVPQRSVANSSVFSRAYLVDRSHMAEFCSALEDVTNYFSNQLGLKFFRSGPWAPYSFSTDEKFSRAYSSLPKRPLEVTPTNPPRQRRAREHRIAGT
jgi:hypothetical protein